MIFCRKSHFSQEKLELSRFQHLSPCSVRAKDGIPLVGSWPEWARVLHQHDACTGRQTVEFFTYCSRTQAIPGAAVLQTILPKLAFSGRCWPGYWAPCHTASVRCRTVEELRIKSPADLHALLHLAAEQWLSTASSQIMSRGAQ